MFPASSELNNALRQIFASVSGLHVIHDDLLIATETLEEHYVILEKTFKLLGRTWINTEWA